jgi:hypothetical protein
MPNEGAAMPVELSIDRASAKVGETIHVRYSWASGAAAEKDWIGIYCAADVVGLIGLPHNAICETGCVSLWQYINTTSDSIPFKIPPSRYGVCEMRYFNRADGTAYDHRGTSSKVITVVDAGVQWGAVGIRIRAGPAGGGPIELGAGFVLSWTSSEEGWKPDAADVIAFYCGDDTGGTAADAEPFGGFGLAATPDHKYLDYALASTLDPQQWAKARGNFSRLLGSTGRLPLCEFRMFRADAADGAKQGAWAGPLSALAWLGTSAPFEVGGHGGPQQLHLALTGRRDEMRIHWTSDSAAAGEVRWWLTNAVHAPTGTANGTVHAPTGTANGTVHTYTAADMCNAPANDAHDFHEPGMLHEAVMRGLQPGVTYNYSVGDDETGWSPRHSFTAAPPAVRKGKRGKGERGSSFEPFKYIVYGDMGVGVPGRWGQCAGAFGDAPGCWGSTTDKQAHMVKVLVEHEVKNNAACMVHHIGDISYAVGNSATWEAFFALIQPIAQHCPYMVGIGNHEMCHVGGGSRDPSVTGDPSAVNSYGAGYCAGVYTDDSLGECGVPMNARFTMPDNGNGLWWYSYDYSALKTIMLSSEHDLHPGSMQHEWLAAQLAAVDRELTPWVVVELHRPMYNNEDYPADYNTGLRIRTALEPLLLQHSVDLVLAGHYHSYMRTTRIINDTVADPGSGSNPGIFHFTIGSAGATLDAIGMVSRKDWQVHFEAQFGYGRITVANKTHMLWEFVRAADSNMSAVAPTPIVGDSAWIIKPGVPPPPVGRSARAGEI